MELVALLLALAAAATMGFAIQRGATCLVSALDEAVNKRRAAKALALAEASLWVSGLLALAALAGIPSAQAATYPASGIALAGGVLLGIGALVNGACVFGSMARLGSGDWHFALTPPGYFLGSLIALALPKQAPIVAGPAMPAGAQAALVLMLALLVLRFAVSAGAAIRAGCLAEWLVRPREATIVIGIAFVALFLLAGPWTYTETLAALARGYRTEPVLHLLLFAALVAGAVAGGWHRRGRFAFQPATAASCLGGGMLMGLGGSMVPGGNDNLILVGIPMLHGYAWMAIAAMAGSIWLGMMARRMLQPLERGRNLP